MRNNTYISKVSTWQAIQRRECNKRMLVIGGSHSICESEVLAKKGVEVISVEARGWRPNLTACADMAANVAEEVKLLNEDNCVVIHCFDNIAFIARSEEGGTSLYANSHQGIILLKATLFWLARNASLCISKTVLQSSSCWRSSRYFSYHPCQDTCTEPAAPARTTHWTSGRMVSRTAWGGASWSPGGITRIFSSLAVLRTSQFLTLEWKSEWGRDRTTTVGTRPSAPVAGELRQDCGPAAEGAGQDQREGAEEDPG